MSGFRDEEPEVYPEEPAPILAKHNEAICQSLRRGFHLCGFHPDTYDADAMWGQLMTDGFTIVALEDAT